MSALGITEVLCKAIESRDYHFILCNYANGDMVGHTGVLGAAVTAVETVDTCVERALCSAEKVGGTVLMQLKPITETASRCKTMAPGSTLVKR